ncbi:MAG TPA: DJ-1/PfpI family protein [Acidimicrobiales bacterium]|nr:DJ-1/PfpI family protein [Acidimicrobiales bacterium]
MQIAIPLFDRFTALDAVGPYEVLSRLPGAAVTFVGERTGPVRTDTRQLAITVDAALSEVDAPDVVVVPGGPGTRAMLDPGPLHEWIAAVHPTTQWTTSVCTGSLILGAAGLLEGLEATTHWVALDTLAPLCARAVGDRRIVEQGKVVTAAGVSAGIDMALWLAARLAGDDVAKAIQLGIEYDPEPPFDSGTTAKADPAMVEMLRTMVVDRTPAG